MVSMQFLGTLLPAENDLTGYWVEKVLGQLINFTELNSLSFRARLCTCIRKKIDVSEHFASTPATKKKCRPTETPKSISKRKCSEVKSATNGSKKKSKTPVKKIRLALPKTAKLK